VRVPPNAVGWGSFEPRDDVNVHPAPKGGRVVLRRHRRTVVVVARAAGVPRIGSVSTAFVDPPQFADPTGQFCAWLTSPVGVVTRLRPGVRLTLAMADFLTGVIEPAIEAERARTGRQAAVYVHDWGEAGGHDASTRPVLVAWGMGLGRARVAEIAFVAGATLPRVSRMAMEVASVSLSLAGIPTRLHKTCADAVAACGLRPLR
jgi:hypothetical protein